MIKQSTGEDWNDTKISLSTAVPSIGGKIPELETQNLRFKQEVRMYSKYVRFKILIKLYSFFLLLNWLPTKNRCRLSIFHLLKTFLKLFMISQSSRQETNILNPEGKRNA